MKKRRRTILFIICVVFFVLVAPLMVLYSQGFRFDFNPTSGGKRIVQTGALYFKVLPTGADVYLNGKFKDKTAFFTNSLLIENLLPKTYQIEIKKEGYHPWQKNLTVKETQVTEAKNIILFPEKLNFTIVNNLIPEIEPSATSSDKKRVIERSNDYEIWILFLEEEEEVFLTRFSEKIGNIFWLTDYYLIFNVWDKIKVAEIDDRDKLNIIDLAQFPEPQIFWDQKNRKLYVLSEEKLYVAENLLP